MSETHPLRLSIVGTSGCGKSTLGMRLASLWNLDHVELDELYWGPNWTPRDDETVRATLQDRLENDRWVVTGNYAMYRSITLARATHVVWLDYSARAVATQLLWRTIRRATTREKIFSGNSESFRQSFASRDSILLWAVKTYHSNRVMYRDLFDSDEFPDVARVHLRSRRATMRWIDDFSQSTSAAKTG